MAIDMTENGEIEVTAFMPIPEKLAEGGGSGGGKGGQDEQPFFTVSGRGVSVAHAYSNIRYKSKYRPYLGHLGLVVFSESVARKGLQPLIDVLERNFKVNRNVLLIVAQDRAKDLLEVEVSAEPNLADYYTSFFEDENLDDAKFKTDLGQYLVQQADPGQESALPLMTAKEEEGKKTPELVGTAVIKDGKLAGSLGFGESRGYALAAGGTTQGVITVTGFDESGQFITVEIRRAKPEFQVEVSGDQISARFSIELSLVTREFTGQELDEDLVPRIESAVGKRLQQDFEAAFAKAQSMNADIFGIGRLVYYKHHNIWSRIDWNQVFPTLPIEVTVQPRLSPSGVTK